MVSRQGRAAEGREPPPVLCYHRVGGWWELGVTRLGRRTFERQLTALAREGWRTLSLSEFAARACRPDANDDRVVLLTFDDGYASLAACALPLLTDLGMRATLFVVTDYIGRTNVWDLPYAGRQRHLSWEELAHWQARGLDVGSHTATHPRLDWLSDAAVLDELSRSRTALATHLGPDAARAVAYPFGRADRRIAALAQHAGYQLGFAVVGGAVPWLVSRTPVYAWDVWSPPLGLRAGWMGRVGRAVARVANRCAVGTAWMQRVVGMRYRRT